MRGMNREMPEGSRGTNTGRYSVVSTSREQVENAMFLKLGNARSSMLDIARQNLFNRHRTLSLDLMIGI